MALGSQLDDNLIFEILSWLPVMALIRFSSVCNSWYSTIHHPSFINQHISNRSRRTDSRKVLVMPDNSPNCTLYPGNTLDYPFDPMLLHLFQVVGLCNGLICVGKKNNYHLYIWNPSLRKLKLLPRSNSYRDSYDNFSSFGIGFHSPSNDYRVVRLTYYYVYRNDADHLLERTEVEVYSLSTDSWRTLSLDHNIRETRKASVSVNGYIYWLATGKRILSFNTANDPFEEIIHPNGSGFYLKSYHIEVVKEQLCVMVAPYTFSFDDKRKEYEIWTMKEHGVYESWTMLWKIEQIDKGISGTFGLTVKGELLQLLELRIGICLYTTMKIHDTMN